MLKRQSHNREEKKRDRRERISNSQGARVGDDNTPQVLREIEKIGGKIIKENKKRRLK